MLAEVELDSRALPYITGELTSGGTLALMLSEIPLEPGRTSTYLPASVEDSVAANFRTSVAMTYGGSISREAQAMLAERIRGYLAGGQKRCLLVETMYLAGDAALEALRVPYLVHRSEVYFAVWQQDIHEIAFALRSARDYPFVAAATSVEGLKEGFPSGSHVGADTLRGMAAHAAHVIVRAYDAEGYIVWTSRAAHMIS